MKVMDGIFITGFVFSFLRELISRWRMRQPRPGFPWHLPIEQIGRFVAISPRPSENPTHVHRWRRCVNKYNFVWERCYVRGKLSPESQAKRGPTILFFRCWNWGPVKWEGWLRRTWLLLETTSGVGCSQGCPLLHTYSYSTSLSKGFDTFHRQVRAGIITGGEILSAFVPGVSWVQKTLPSTWKALNSCLLHMTSKERYRRKWWLEDGIAQGQEHQPESRNSKRSSLMLPLPLCSCLCISAPIPGKRMLQFNTDITTEYGR